MVVTEVSMLHHIGVVLIVIWGLASLGCSHAAIYFTSFIYLYLVNEGYTLRLQKRLRLEEIKQANQRKLLCDAETVRWLNDVVERIWPICMEEIVSQKFLLPIVPWFLDKYKPWTARKAVMQNLYLGRSPPMFTEVRVLSQANDGDNLVLEMGMNFLSADDMCAVLAVKLRKRFGFGMWARMHITGMHVEGKVLVGVKFLNKWPFLGRVRVCFKEPPYFQMTVKPIFSHGVDVTEVPGIAGWLDKLLAVAFEQTLVAPNILVVDVEKFSSPSDDPWFSMDEKRPIALVKVEILEAVDMKPSDLNGLADPYVKGQLGPYRFRTKTQKKTLTPKWQEEFKIPVCSWACPNILLLEVRDKDPFLDDALGDCSIDVSEFRGRERQEKWIPLQNIRMGRLHVAISVLDMDETDAQQINAHEGFKEKEINSPKSETAAGVNNDASEQPEKLVDELEPIKVEGQNRTAIWVLHPGSEIHQTWEPRKGKIRPPGTKIIRKDNDTTGSLAAGRDRQSSSSPTDDENPDGNGVHPMRKIRKSIKKLGSVFHRSPKSETASDRGSVLPTPRSVDDKSVEAGSAVLTDGNVKDVKGEPESPGTERDEAGSPTKGNPIKGAAKSMLKQAGKSAQGIKHALTSDRSSKHDKNTENMMKVGSEPCPELESTDDSLTSSREYTPKCQEDLLYPPCPSGRILDSPTMERDLMVEMDPNRSSVLSSAQYNQSRGSPNEKKFDPNGHDDILSLHHQPAVADGQPGL